MSEEKAPVPMPGSMEEIQALLDRPDNLLTVARPIELPRVPHDGSPRLALIIAGPEGVVLANMVMDYIDALVAQSKQHKAEARHVN